MMDLFTLFAIAQQIPLALIIVVILVIGAIAILIVGLIMRVIFG